MSEKKKHLKAFLLDVVNREDGVRHNEYWFVEEKNLTARRAKMFFEKKYPNLKVKRIITYLDHYGI